MTSRLRAAVSTALLCALAGTALAGPFDKPPPPAAPRPFVIAAPAELSLPNGMRVIVARREGVPLVSAMLVALSGSEADPPRLSGLASLTAGLLTQGTRHHTAPQLAAAAEALGGSLESAAGWGQSLVSITVTTPRLDAALGLVAEVVREPTFATEEIERLRTQTLDGLKVSYASPGTLASLAADRMAYGATPWGHPETGTPASLPRIGRNDLLAMHRATFRPERSVLILAGDIDAATARALAVSHFGAWTGAGATPPPAPALPSVAAGAGLAIVDMAGSGQAGVALALPLPSRHGSDWATGAVLNAVLGGGYSSRLNEEIRIKRGLSYGASSRIEARLDAGLFHASIQTKNESAADVVKLVQAELDGMTTAPVGGDELAARKATLIGGVSRNVETTSGLASAIRALVASRRPPAELTRQIGAIEAVTPADVQAYAAAHFARADRRIAVAGVASSFGDALRAEVPGLIVIRQDALDLDGVIGPVH